MGRLVEKYAVFTVGLSLFVLLLVSACQSMHEMAPRVNEDIVVASKLLSYPGTHALLGTARSDVERVLHMQPYLIKNHTYSYGPFDNGVHAPFFLQIKTNGNGDIVVARVTAKTKDANPVLAFVARSWCSALLPGDAQVAKKRYYDSGREYWITVYNSAFLKNLLPQTGGDVQMVESLVAGKLNDCIVAVRGEDSIS